MMYYGKQHIQVYYFFFLNLEISVQHVKLPLRRTGGLGPPLYYWAKDCEI